MTRNDFKRKTDALFLFGHNTEDDSLWLPAWGARALRGLITEALRGLEETEPVPCGQDEPRQMNAAGPMPRDREADEDRDDPRIARDRARAAQIQQAHLRVKAHESVESLLHETMKVMHKYIDSIGEDDATDR